MLSSLEQLLSNMSVQVFSMTIQVVLTAAGALYIKDLATRLINFLKMKFSDFGRGTKVEFAGKIGYITKVTFGQVEISIDDESIMIVPISRFLTQPKIIYTKLPDRDQQD